MWENVQLRLTVATRFMMTLALKNARTYFTIHQGYRVGDGSQIVSYLNKYRAGKKTIHAKLQIFKIKERRLIRS